MAGWKKLFMRARIKNAETEPIPTPEIHPLSDICIAGFNASSTKTVQQYVDDYVTNSRKSIGNKLYLGDLDYTCPECFLYIGTQNCVQICGVGNVYDDRTAIVIKTKTGNYYVNKQPTPHQCPIY
jgi:hypothetical protein